MKIEQGVALARFTTLGTGGPARAFARPESVDGARGGARAGRASRSCRVATVGLGSNLLVADEGVDGLVLKLGGELAEASRSTASGSLAGGGAANAVCLHRAREAGLGGFEFACAIPGTIGGGVWMNAGAYGGDWRSDPRPGARRRRRRARAGSTPAELGLSYRHSELRPRPGRRARRVRLAPLPEEQIKANVAELQAQRKAAQPTNKRTFGSVFKNPEHELTRGPDARGVRPEGAPDRRRADLAAPRELHRERGRRPRRGRASR